MGRGGQLGTTATKEPIPASGYFLRQRWGPDDVLELVEQLDVATSALCEESQEAYRLRLSIAATKQETAMVELATTEA